MGERKRAEDKPAPARKSKRDEEAAAHKDEMLDEALDESFPASDPPSSTQPHRRGNRKD